LTTRRVAAALATAGLTTRHAAALGAAALPTRRVAAALGAATLSPGGSSLPTALTTRRVAAALPAGLTTLTAATLPRGGLRHQLLKLRLELVSFLARGAKQLLSDVGQLLPIRSGQGRGGPALTTALATRLSLALATGLSPAWAARLSPAWGARLSPASAGLTTLGSNHCSDH
jgi:hypothetical protein